MVSLSFLAVAVACISSASSTYIREPEILGWKKTGFPSSTDEIELIVSVKKQNLDQLFDFVSKVSTPSSPLYKQYMTADEVNQLTAPRSDDVSAVSSWLSPLGSIDIKNGVITVKTIVSKAEDFLKTKFHIMEEMQGERSVNRADSYVIPSDVSPLIDHIFGLHGVPLPKQARTNKDQGLPPQVTPEVLTNTYGIKGVKPAGNTKNRMAVAEFQGQYMNTSDLKAFFEMFYPNAPASDSEVYAFHGKTMNGEGIEAQLDIQFIMGVAPGVKTEFYEMASMDFCADLKNWTELLSATDDIPFVHSISYGWQGNLTQIGCTPDAVKDVDTNFAKLAARGISIIFASGDSGSGYAPPMPPQPPQCDHEKPGTVGENFEGDILRTLRIGVPRNEPNEGPFICCTIAGEIGSQEGYAGWSYVEGACINSNECEGNCTILKTLTKRISNPKYTSGVAKKIPPPPPGPKKAPLWPSWPASSPFVTAVGATRFYQDNVHGGVEAAVSQEDHFGSGGGFSPWTALSQPKWQLGAVNGYFKTATAKQLPTPAASYNKDGRATPDVSALGTGYAVVNGGKLLPGGVGGTSASAPAFAGMIALINDALVQAGKKPLGFLNPFLYAADSSFSDVTIGSDKVGRGGSILPEGFNCTVGWDPVTGLGTPLFGKLLKGAMGSRV